MIPSGPAAQRPPQLALFGSDGPDAFPAPFRADAFRAPAAFRPVWPLARFFDMFFRVGVIGRQPWVRIAD